MRIALIGDGRMGRAVAERARERGHEVTAMLGIDDNRDGSGIERDRLGDPEVAIEFTEPTSAVRNVRACARAGIPVVVGTTGWYAELDTVLREVGAAGGSMLWAPNFSIGVAIVTAAMEAAAAAMKQAGGFDAHMIETHHSAKKDQPSGTAQALADAAGQQLGRAIPITSVRTGHVPGTHELILDAPYEQVRVVHEARDRRVFADGAVTAAEWLRGRRGIFTMRDVVKLEGGER
jgi:4-hydroxy-tetrahydrodipicolinate reductase